MKLTKLAPLAAAAVTILASCSEVSQPQADNPEGTEENVSPSQTTSASQLPTEDYDENFTQVFGQSFDNALREVGKSKTRRATAGGIDGLSFNGVEGIESVDIGGIFIMPSTEANGLNSDFRCQIGDNVSQIAIKLNVPKSTMFVLVSDETSLTLLGEELREMLTTTTIDELDFTTFEIAEIRTRPGDRMPPPCTENPRKLESSRPFSTSQGSTAQEATATK